MDVRYGERVHVPGKTEPCSPAYLPSPCGHHSGEQGHACVLLRAGAAVAADSGQGEASPQPSAPRGPSYSGAVCVQQGLVTGPRTQGGAGSGQHRRGLGASAEGQACHLLEIGQPPGTSGLRRRFRLGALCQLLLGAQSCTDHGPCHRPQALDWPERLRFVSKSRAAAAAHPAPGTPGTGGT